MPPVKNSLSAARRSAPVVVVPEIESLCAPAEPRRQGHYSDEPTGLNGDPDLIPAVYLRVQQESGRQSCLKIDLFSGDGVLEFQKLSVQKVSSIAGEPGEIFKRLAVCAV